MVIHHVVLIGVGIAKGIAIAGHALGHVLTAETAVSKAVLTVGTKSAVLHPEAALALAGATVGVPIVTIAYLDTRKLAAEAGRRGDEQPGGISAKHVKFAVAGRLAQGEFTCITGPMQSGDVVLHGLFDKQRQEIVRQRIIRPTAVEQRLAQRFSGGALVVLN